MNESTNFIYWNNYLYRLNAQRQLTWACPFRYTTSPINKFARVFAAPDVLDVRALPEGMYFLQLRSARYGLVGGASFVKG